MQRPSKNAMVRLIGKSCMKFGVLIGLFVDADQALPGQSGTSHRWDSGPSGHVEVALTNTSPGTIRSGGVFGGRMEKNYTLTIRNGGEMDSTDKARYEPPAGDEPSHTY